MLSGPPNFYVYLPKIKIYLPRAIGLFPCPSLWVECSKVVILILRLILGRCCVELHHGSVLGTGNWVKILPQKQSHSAIRLNSDPVLRATSKFSSSGTLGRMGSSFRRSNFWNYLGGQALSNDWSIVFESTINESEVTPFHPKDPRNCPRRAESFHPFSL